MRRDWKSEWKAMMASPYGRWYMAVLLMALCYQWIFQREWVDTAEYLRKAQSIWAGWTPRDSDRLLEYSRRSPLFGLLLWALGPLYSLVSALLSLLTLLQLRMWIREQSSYQNAPEYATVFWLFHPLLLVYAVVPMPECICLWLLLAWLRALSSSNEWVLGMTAAALLALKPVFAVLLPLMILAQFMGLISSFTVRKAAIMVLPLALVWGFNSFDNYRALGFWHFSSMGLTNALEYNLPAYGSAIELSDAAGNAAETATVWKEQIRQVVWGNPLRVIWIHLRGVVLGLLDPGRYDIWAFFGAQGDAQHMKALIKGNFQALTWNAGLLFMAIGALVQALFLVCITFGLMKNGNFRQHQFWALVVLVFLGLSGPVASARYTLLVYPILALWFSEGWGSRKERRFR